MAIEATGILTDPGHSQRVSEDGTRTKGPRAQAGETEVEGRSGGDRLDYSPSALRKRLVGGFRRLAHAGFENPGKRPQLARELGHRFRDALHTLKKAGVLDKSEVKSLRRAYKNALEAVASPDASLEISSASSARQSRTFSLSIETTEGDSVRIDLQRQESFEQSLAVESDGEGEIRAEQQTTVARESVLRFSVEGDLNEEERAAISDLVARVDQLAVRFFEGDVQATLEYVQQFGLPDDEIAAFSVDLGYSLEARVIDTYRQVEALAPPEDTPDPSAALELSEDLRQLSESVRLESLFTDSRSLVFDFFRAAVESDLEADSSS